MSLFAELSPMERMIRARAQLIIKQPFFGTLALHLELVESHAVRTMSTDGKKILFNPIFLYTLDDEEIEAVIAHEVYHCALRHHTRRGKRERKLWNAAADYAANRDLLMVPFKLPKWALFDPRFDGLTAEEIYYILEQEREQGGGGEEEGEEAGDGENGDGAGKPGGSDPGGCGEIVDAEPEGSEGQKAEEEAVWESHVRAALAVATRHHGSIPAHLRRLSEVLNNPRKDWREELDRFVDPMASTTTTWSMPNKRFIGRGMILPRQIRDGVNHLGIGVDVSGSIDQKAINSFTGHIQGMLDTGMVSKVTAVYCDDEVQKVEEFEAGDQVKIDTDGGGGTAMAPVFAWFLDNAPDVAGIVMLSDLIIGQNDFGPDPGIPTLWAGYGSPQDLKHWGPLVPFGEVIELID
jgi:predicted metal-dependent peptidase